MIGRTTDDSGSKDTAKRSREGAEPAKGGREDRPSATSGGDKASKPVLLMRSRVHRALTLTQAGL
jgi:hypothetical protein